MFEAGFSELQPLLEQALARESDDVEDNERAVAAQGMARAAELLQVDGDRRAKWLGMLERLPPLKINPQEVARAFTIPLADLRAPAAWTTRSWTTPSGSVPVYYFPYDGELLWGLSAYVALQLLDLTEGGPPFPIADYTGDPDD